MVTVIATTPVPSDPRDAEQLLAAVAPHAGLRYLQVLVRSLTEQFGVAYAFVAERSPGDRDVAQTVAVADRGGPIGQIVYLIAGTPCSGVIADGTLRVAHGARHAYPGDAALAEMGVESYVGTLLAANGGTSCGWLGVMDVKPRADTLRLEAALRALAPRTGAELAQMRMERRALASRDAAQLSPLP